MDNNQMNQYDNGGGRNNDGRGNGSSGGNGGNGQPNRPNWLIMLLTGVAILMMVMLFWQLLFGGSSNGRIVSYTEFINQLKEGKVEAVELKDGMVNYTLKSEPQENTGDNPLELNPFYSAKTQVTYSAYLMESESLLTQRLEAAGVEGGYVPTNNTLYTLFISVILPVVLMVALMSLLFRKIGGSGGPMGVGKSNAKVYVQKETGVTFKDVAGEDEAKESLVEVVDFLHNPGKYSKIGAKLPKGALLVGPPGTGKTLLAKAVAGEAHVPFFSLTGSDFIELYVGVGASRVRDLFKEATKNAPCIIFIDEIDAIGRSRDSKYGGGNEEREQTLNQLLSEMDGFDSSKGILILGATNRPEILDKALLRPGRFDRRIIVDKPDLKGRVEILKVHAKDVKMDESVDLDAIALATSGAVGSDLANMINEAAINAVKEKREYVSQKDLFNAVEVVLVGKEKKDRIMSKEERRIVSYHEVGHALVSALQKNSEPVQKITIVPRTMGALGYVMHVPEEEKYLNTEAELRDMLVSLVAGRAAEEVVFDTVTTGAANDIEKATDIARSMVTQYGMSKKFGLIGLATVQSKYLDGGATLNCSDPTAAEVDAEVIAILKESYEKALSLLKENREVMDKLAAFLIEKETITGKEFMEIYRREKGMPESEEKEKQEKQEGNHLSDNRELSSNKSNYSVNSSKEGSNAASGSSAINASNTISGSSAINASNTISGSNAIDTSNATNASNEINTSNTISTSNVKEALDANKQADNQAKDFRNADNGNSTVNFSNISANQADSFQKSSSRSNMFYKNNEAVENQLISNPTEFVAEQHIDIEINDNTVESSNAFPNVQKDTVKEWKAEAQKDNESSSKEVINQEAINQKKEDNLEQEPKDKKIVGRFSNGTLE